MRLGLRGKLVLVLVAQAGISLACGWAAMIGNVNDEKSWGLVAASLVLLPTTVAWLAAFTLLSAPYDAERYSTSRLHSLLRTLVDAGGVSHSTLLPRIIPLSSFTSIISIALSAALGQNAQWVILAHTALAVAVSIGCGTIGTWRMSRAPKHGAIRLPSGNGSRVKKDCQEEKEGSLEELDADERMQGLKADGSWVSSPCESRSTVHWSDPSKL